MTDKKIVMRCNHCENTAGFKIIALHEHKEYERHQRYGKMVSNITWKFLECQTCSRPTVVQHVEWCQIYEEDEDELLLNPIPMSTTLYHPKEGKEVNCDDLGETVIYPDFIPSTTPSPDMPEDIADDFNEARAVFSASPRASAALLRLVIMNLLPPPFLR